MIGALLWLTTSIAAEPVVKNSITQQNTAWTTKSEADDQAVKITNTLENSELNTKNRWHQAVKVKGQIEKLLNYFHNDSYRDYSWWQLLSNIENLLERCMKPETFVDFCYDFPPKTI